MFREEWVNDKYYHIPVELRHINDTKGWGVFALEAIPKNTVVEVSPVILYHRDLHDAARELADCSLSFMPNRHILESYAFDWPSSGMRALTMGYGGMYNHSFKPNMKAVKQDQPINAVVFVTIRDVPAGEELTHMYAPWADALPFDPEEEDYIWKEGHMSYLEAEEARLGHMDYGNSLETARARHIIKQEDHKKRIDSQPKMGDWIKGKKDESP